MLVYSVCIYSILIECVSDRECVSDLVLITLMYLKCARNIHSFRNIQISDWDWVTDRGHNIFCTIWTSLISKFLNQDQFIFEGKLLKILR